MKKKDDQNAFTLVELSIVLVIIGLIVSGVLVGQQLIETAKMRSIMNEYRNYNIALNSFQLKYNSLPGDIPNASDFWPSAIGDGNGDGDIQPAIEHIYAWQHLSLAGLLAGSYAGTGNYEANVTVPASSYTPSVWSFYGGSLYGNYSSYFIFGEIDGASSNWGSVLVTEQLLLLEKKYDDGQPDEGIIYGAKRTGGASGICVTSHWNFSVDSEYSTDMDGECEVAFNFDNFVSN